ncbi:MAG: hypothetical protein VX663_05080 [Pseudomonadota bacterium]|nr:hypothetical protein [Pseudomonadota bacterium]
MGGEQSDQANETERTLVLNEPPDLEDPDGDDVTSIDLDEE